MIVDDLFESPQTCPECGGPAFSDLLLAEKKDACYNKVRSRYKVWPSAYASGALVQCRKKGAANWGNKSEGVAEASPEATFNALKGLKTWQVVIMNNYYRGKYSDYSGRYYYVLAASPEQAQQVVLDNADAILQDLLSMKSVNGKKILPRGSALRITADRIGEIRDGTEHGRMTTAGFKKMFGPQGPMMVKLANGAIADVQGQEQGVAEGSETAADIDKKIEFHKQGQAAAQYKGSMNKMHAAKIRELEAKKAALKQGVAEGSEQVYKVLAVDKSNALSKQVKLKVKASSLDEVFERLAINDWYPLEINGVEVVNGKRLKQGVAEGPGFDKWADERAASQLHKLNIPKTWILNVMDEVTGEHWAIEIQATSPDMAKERAQQQGYKVLRIKEKGVAEGDKVGNMDADQFDAAMARLKQLAGEGPRKTVWDPVKRVYKTVPVNPPQSK